MKRPKQLSALFVKTVKQPGRYGDGRAGHGLSLLVKPLEDGSLSKTWSQRLYIDGKPAMIGLGTYPIVTLADARKAALANRRTLAQGTDPRRPSGIPTFEEAAERVIQLRKPTWKDGVTEARIWRGSFRNYVYPAVGGKKVNKITSADVLGVLEPVWNTKQETARRVRQRIGAVMKWSMGQGYRTDNPAGEAISQALPQKRGAKRHYPALHYSDVAEAIRVVRASGAYTATVLCFEFLVLTATRSGEARLARWDEIDLQARMWTIPGDRMKSGRRHRVPLSKPALAVLDKAHRLLNDGSGLIFPSANGRTLSNMTLSKLVKELGIVAVPHGFRSSFRDWAAEQTNAPRAVMEAALAHTYGDAAEQAYARSELVEKRRGLMEAWGEYVTAAPR